MNEEQLIERSRQMKQAHTDFLVNHLNPHEEQNRIFILDVIKFYDIKSHDEFCQYEHLMPDCPTRTVIRYEFLGLEKRK